MDPSPTQSEESFLVEMAARYIWWKSPREAIAYPDRIIAQVMDIGIWNDVKHLLDIVGEDRLAAVIRRAEAGWFSPKSWHFWHYRLGLSEIGKVPPLPGRKIPQ